MSPPFPERSDAIGHARPALKRRATTVSATDAITPINMARMTSPKDPKH